MKKIMDLFYFTKNFEEISNNVINSIILFSKYKIEVNTINYGLYK